MTRMIALLTAGLLTACATATTPDDPAGLAPADVGAALRDAAALAALDLPTAPSDLSVLDGTGSDVRVARHAASDGHDTYALTMPPAFAGLGSPATAVSVPPDVTSAGWEDRGTEGFAHRPSGLTCPLVIGFGADGPRLALQAIHTYDAAGTDTGCNYLARDGGAVFTLFASRWPDVSLRQHFEQAARLMPREVPVGSPAPAPVAILRELPPDTQIEGETMSLAYTSPPTGGRVLLTSLYLNKVGGWHVKMRATHTPPAEIMQVFAAVVHASALIEVDEAQRGIGPLVAAEPVRLAAR